MKVVKKVSVLVCVLLGLTVACEAQVYKGPTVVVSYESSTAKGLRNRDSASAAMRRLNVPYDSVDRTAFDSTTIAYTPWDVLIWSTGDPAVSLGANPALGIGALSAKETEEITTFLKTIRKPYKKSLVIAGQNIGYYNDFLNVNRNGIGDTAFMHQMLHAKYLARTPVAGGFDATIKGDVPVYFTFNDHLTAETPNVVARTFKTPTVAPEVTAVPYKYLSHPAYAADSGAGVAYYGPQFVTVFFAFDWADLLQIIPSEAGLLTSGATRVIRGALDFIQSAGYSTISVEADQRATTNSWKLDQNYPNPFNSTTEISFTLDAPSIIIMRILDASGKNIQTPVDGKQYTTGDHKIIVNADDFPSGTYIYELTATQSDGHQTTLTGKMTVAK